MSDQLVNTALSQLEGKADIVTPLFLNGGAVSLPSSGEVIYVKKDNTATPLTLIPKAGQTVDNGASYSLTVQNESVYLKLIGSNWTRF